MRLRRRRRGRFHDDFLAAAADGAAFASASAQRFLFDFLRDWIFTAEASQAFTPSYIATRVAALLFGARVYSSGFWRPTQGRIILTTQAPSAVYHDVILFRHATRYFLSI